MTRFWAYLTLCLAGSCTASHPGSSDGDGTPPPDGSTPATDSGVHEDLTSCSVPSDCVLTSGTCCGTCGEPTVGDMVAIRQDRLNAYRENVCEDNPICPACAVMPNPNLIASCVEETCTAIDLATHAVGECAGDDQCVVTAPACCECGADTSPYSLVSIRSGARSDLQSLLCDSDTACLECAPVYPSEVTAQCGNSGYCEVVVDSP